MSCQGNDDFYGKKTSKFSKLIPDISMDSYSEIAIKEKSVKKKAKKDKVLAEPQDLKTPSNNVIHGHGSGNHMMNYHQNCQFNQLIVPQNQAYMPNNRYPVYPYPMNPYPQNIQNMGSPYIQYPQNYPQVYQPNFYQQQAQQQLNEETLQSMNIINDFSKSSTSSSSIEEVKEKSQKSEKKKKLKKDSKSKDNIKEESKSRKRSSIDRSKEMSRDNQRERTSTASSPVGDEESLTEEEEILKEMLSKCRYAKLIKQKDSKKLQKLLDKLKLKKSISCIFEAILEEDFCKIASSNFGNYFIQNLLTKITPDEQLTAWKVFSESNKEVFFSEFGNRVIQNLISLLYHNGQKKKITAVLEPMLTSLAYHKYGSFILHGIIEKFDIYDLGFLEAFIEENFYSLIFHINGVVLLKRYIPFLKRKSANLAEFLKKYILDKTYFLSQDKYAHFLILWIFDQINPTDRLEFDKKLVREAFILIKDEFGSKVVLKLCQSAEFDVSLYLFFRKRSV